MRAVSGPRGLLLAVLALAAAALAAPAGASAAFGEAHVLAPFPANPGYPEGVAVRNGRVYSAGAATFGTAGKGPSTVIVNSRTTGAQLNRFDTVGENLALEHANSSIAFDGQGRLYVLNSQLGIYRLNVATGAQTSYTPPFPDLPACGNPVVKPCSPTPFDAPPLPNDIAFAPSGEAYVTDSLQATIWLIPRGGGTPQVWRQDPRFASTGIGVNGLRLNGNATRVYVTVTMDLLNQASVYSLSRLPFLTPIAQQPRLEYRFAPDEFPDGVAFGQSGDLFVSMASPAAPGVLILRPNGTIKAQLTNPPGSPTVPYDGPANIAFDGAGRILMSNHAPFTGVNFSILDVDVQDKGTPLYTPLEP
jgi:sugar lactone lactonase YvrE